jgi:cytochrome c oxidase subunit I+III
MRSLAIRAHPLVFGTVVFLASESMLFAALLAAYYDLRGASAVWPPAGIQLHAGEMGAATALLALGSVTAAFAQSAAERSNARIARLLLGITILAAVGFLVLELLDWQTANFHIRDSAYATLYYTITGTHFAHVAAGIALLAMVAIFLRAPAFTRAHHAAVAAAAYYWHFVFAVWLALYASLFWVR